VPWFAENLGTGDARPKGGQGLDRQSSPSRACLSPASGAARTAIQWARILAEIGEGVEKNVLLVFSFAISYDAGGFCHYRPAGMAMSRKPALAPAPLFDK